MGTWWHLRGRGDECLDPNMVYEPIPEGVAAVWCEREGEANGIKPRWWVSERCVCGSGHITKLQRWADKHETVPRPRCGVCDENTVWSGKGEWTWVTGEAIVMNEREAIA